MKTSKSDHSNLSEEQMALVEKVEEILGAGGRFADTLSVLIVGAHRQSHRELQQAESPAETGVDDAGKDSPADVPRNRLGCLTFDQSDRFNDALSHLDIIYELLVNNGNDNFRELSSLLLHPKEIFEQLDTEFDAAHQVIPANRPERREVHAL